MKLCDVAQFYSPLGGGVRRYLDEKARWVAEHPEHQHVMVRPGAEDRVLREAGTTVYEIASPRLPGSASYRILLGRRRMLRILARERPDVLEVDGPYRAAWIALEAGRRLGVPVAGFYHSDFPRSLGRTLQRFAGRWARRLLDPVTEGYVVGLYNRMAVTLAPSPRVRRALVECGVERTRTVALGVDTDRFAPRPDAAARLRAELGVGDGELLLLQVGRLAREKNVASVLAMVEHLRGREGLPPFRLLLVGDGERRRQVEAAARRDPAISWRPYLERAGDLAACYTAADLLVHAGTYETFGLVSIEAQACGTPVVAVAGGGLESTLVGDTLEPGRAAEQEHEAVFATSAAPADLAAAVARAAALHGTGWGSETGAASRAARRRRIVERFHVTATFERLFGLYAEVLATAAEGGRIPDVCDRETRRAGHGAGPPPDPRPTLSYR